MRFQAEIIAFANEIFAILSEKQIRTALKLIKELIFQHFVRSLQFLLRMPTKSSIFLRNRKVNQTLSIIPNISFLNYDIISRPTSLAFAPFFTFDQKRYINFICDIIIRLHYSPPYFHIIRHLLQCSKAMKSQKRISINLKAIAQLCKKLIWTLNCPNLYLHQFCLKLQNLCNFIDVHVLIVLNLMILLFLKLFQPIDSKIDLIGSLAKWSNRCSFQWWKRQIWLKDIRFNYFTLIMKILLNFLLQIFPTEKNIFKHIFLYTQSNQVTPLPSHLFDPILLKMDIIQ